MDRLRELPHIKASELKTVFYSRSLALKEIAK
jgi:hypothetical protein